MQLQEISLTFSNRKSSQSNMCRILREWMHVNNCMVPVCIRLRLDFVYGCLMCDRMSGVVRVVNDGVLERAWTGRCEGWEI